MPAYQLVFDDDGRPQFEEEFGGEHPEDTAFRRIASLGTRRGWASVVVERTAEPVTSRARNDWELLAGAADLDRRLDCDSTRPAPFAFGAGRPA